MTAARRLAAILAVDVVGYSRLMGEDEAGTARAVGEHREAARPILTGCQNQIVNTTSRARSEIRLMSRRLVVRRDVKWRRAWLRHVRSAFPCARQGARLALQGQTPPAPTGFAARPREWSGNRGC